MLSAILNCIEKKKSITLDCPGVTPSELAAALGTTPSAVSKMLRGMEERGLISRIPDTKDRRIVYLNLGSQGLSVLEQAQKHMQELTMHLAEKMGQEEVKQLIVLLKKLYRIMKEEYKEDITCSK